LENDLCPFEARPEDRAPPAEALEELAASELRQRLGSAFSKVLRPDKLRMLLHRFGSALRGGRLRLIRDLPKAVSPLRFATVVQDSVEDRTSRFDPLVSFRLPRVPLRRSLQSWNGSR
jgi:hypothetical protein